MRLGDRRQGGAQARTGKSRQRGFDEQHIGRRDDELDAAVPWDLGEHGASAVHDHALLVEHLEVERDLGAELGEGTEAKTQRLQPASFIQRTSSVTGSRRTSAWAARRAGP